MAERVTPGSLVRRGDIFYADLSPVVGSEQRGIRPVLVVQNDVANRFSPTVVVCALTSRLKRPALPTHVRIPGVGTRAESIALVEQLRTLDKHRLLRRIGHADPAVMRRIDQALGYALDLLATGGIDPAGSRRVERRPAGATHPEARQGTRLVRPRAGAHWAGDDAQDALLNRGPERDSAKSPSE